MSQLPTTPHISSKPEWSLNRLSGSGMGKGLKGSDAGTRPQDEDRYSLNQELRRRKFFDHAGRLERPALPRRNATPNIPRSLNTMAVETVAEVAGAVRNTIAHRSVPFHVAPSVAAIPVPSPLTVPAVPKFPTFSNPTVPTVPAYPFHTPSSQSVLSTPPSSPLSSDVSFALSAISTSSHSTPESSTSSHLSGCLDTALSTQTPSLNASYFNSTVTARSSLDRNTSTSLNSSHQTTFLIRTTSTSIDPTSISNGFGSLAATASTAASATTSGPGVDLGGSSSGSEGANTPQVVGGVVGGLSGLAVVLLILLLLLRRYRQQLRNREQTLENDGPSRSAPNDTSIGSSRTPLVAAFSSSFKKIRPESSPPNAMAATRLSERSFQRVAGRKIEPVLESGGDGFGGNYGAFEKEQGLGKEAGLVASSSKPEAQPTAATSFYRGDSSLYSNHDSGTSTPIGGQTRLASGNQIFAVNRDGDDNDHGSRQDDVAVMRASPARSPVTTRARADQLAAPRPEFAMASNIPPSPTASSRFIVDDVGRSLVSQDGSRGSRFTEGV